MASSPDDPNLPIQNPYGLRRTWPVGVQLPPPTNPYGLHRTVVPSAQDQDLWTQARAARDYEENQQAARQEYGEDHPFLSGVASGYEGLKA